MQGEENTEDASLQGLYFYTQDGTEPDSSKQSSQTQDPGQRAQGSVGQGKFRQGTVVQGLDLEALFGKVIRTVQPGGSFGELALLHKDALRTASVIAGPPEDAAMTQPHTVDLIRICKMDYDLTVSAIQLLFL